MAYGDSVAAIIGKRYGKQKIINEKTLEGSLSMFLVICVGLTLVFAFFSWISTFVLSDIFIVVLGVAVVATVSEALCPKGLDNLFVPLLIAFSFIMLSGN